jgi:hypothetical protein
MGVSSFKDRKVAGGCLQALVRRLQQSVSPEEDAMGVAAHEIAWQHDLEQALKDSSSGGTHVLVDFSAAPM